jgi:hypothetical protein
MRNNNDESKWFPNGPLVGRELLDASNGNGFSTESPPVNVMFTLLMRGSHMPTVKRTDTPCLGKECLLPVAFGVQNRS